jgi:Bacteriophage holin family
MKDWLLALFLSALSVLAPIKPMLITVGILILMDAVTGIYAAYKRKEPISSAAMRRTVSKLLVYQGVVISGFLLELNLLDHLIPVAKLVAGAIGVVEFKSILENSNSIMGVDIFKSIIDKLGSDNAIPSTKDKEDKKE